MWTLRWQLFRSKDKLLRAMLVSHIVSDIRNMNRYHRNDKVRVLAAKACRAPHLWLPCRPPPRPAPPPPHTLSVFEAVQCRVLVGVAAAMPRA